ELRGGVIVKIPVVKPYTTDEMVGCFRMRVGGCRRSRRRARNPGSDRAGKAFGYRIKLLAGTRRLFGKDQLRGLHIENVGLNPQSLAGPSNSSREQPVGI